MIIIERIMIEQGSSLGLLRDPQKSHGKEP